MLEQTVKVDSNKDDANFSISFVNASNKTVTIKKIHSSCGCTIPRLKQKGFKPGEDGQITATMDLAGVQKGRQKQIRVWTDEKGAAGMYLLSLKALIPVYVDVSPGQLTWEHGDRTPKKVLLTARNHSVRIDYSRISSIVGIAKSTVELEKGKKWEITIDPTADCPKGRGALKVKVQPKNATSISLRVPLVIN